MNIIDWAIATIERFGGPGVAFLIALESVFPPIPSEVILPLAGVTAAGPQHSYAGMLIWATVGSLVGALVLYGLGRLLGPERLRAAFVKLPLFNAQDFDKTVEWNDRHGSKGIFFGRMVPGVRSLISIPAGIYQMPIWKFSLLTTAGSLLWNTIFVTFGYTLGHNWHVTEPYTEWFSRIIYVIIALLVVWWLIKLVRRERARRASGEPDPDAEEKAAAERRPR